MTPEPLADAPVVGRRPARGDGRPTVTPSTAGSVRAERDAVPAGRRRSAADELGVLDEQREPAGRGWSASPARPPARRGAGGPR